MGWSEVVDRLTAYMEDETTPRWIIPYFRELRDWVVGQAMGMDETCEGR